MTLTDDELRRLVALIAERREQVAADDILELINSKGEHLQIDKDARCRAFGSILRSLLGDPAVQQMLKLTRERSQFRTAIADLHERTKNTPYPNSTDAASIVVKMEESESGIAAEINRLEEHEKAKLWLLDNVIKILKDLGCDDRFDLPTVQMRLPKLG